jgi:hypothetical protein
MKDVPSRRLVLVLAMLLAMGGAFLGNATPAAAWNTPRQTLHLRMVNNTGDVVNDLTVRIIGFNCGLPWQAPAFRGAAIFTPGWAMTGVSTAPMPNGGSALVVTFAGPNLAVGNWNWVNIDILIPGNNPVCGWESIMWARWTKDGAPVGDWVAQGFCVSSPPRLGNPDVTPEGVTNTRNMVVRNLQFARSSQIIPNDQLTLENPAVLALFSASPDPIKPGPLTVAPNNCFDIPNVDPSITPQPLIGQSVLVRGTVEDGSGQQYSFVDQFMSTPAELPMMSPWGVGLLAVLMGLLGAIMVWRVRRRSDSLEASA